jgi:hypothetical protein
MEEGMRQQHECCVCNRQCSVPVWNQHTKSKHASTSQEAGLQVKLNKLEIQLKEEQISRKHLEADYFTLKAESLDTLRASASTPAQQGVSM